MGVNWVEPLKYAKKSYKWIGTVEFGDSVIEVASQVFDKNIARNGGPAPRWTGINIGRLVQKALDNHEQDMAVIAAPLADLYNESWRKPRARKLTPERLQKELKLEQILLAQGETFDQYTIRLADPRERFRGYIPGAEINSGKVTNISIRSTYDANGNPLLPYLEDMMHPKLPVDASAKRIGKKVLLTKQTKRFKWAVPLSYDGKAKRWEGEIDFQKKRLVVSVTGAKKTSPETWAGDRLSQILACISPATKEAAHQLTELYNSAWVEDRELSVTAVKRRIKLDSIEFTKKDWSLCFTDGDLFGGHGISADISGEGDVSCELFG